ncbi:hypothetical protein I0C86_40610 [Plantactinospora sp. S1510]|uniref:Uncharacterized protein n=1 Tax=Plantactinospora alkalitolerans TaxID=2789879 RepID=A0ABS0H9M0_9ACTN|nr:hypothetical protein [Plantactinospora alkalitolerans]MBF9135183.1 hypothetical protein [Plantactinospora alkalitolerans]
MIEATVRVRVGDTEVRSTRPGEGKASDYARANAARKVARDDVLDKLNATPDPVKEMRGAVTVTAELSVHGRRLRSELVMEGGDKPRAVAQALLWETTGDVANQLDKLAPGVRRFWLFR